MVVEVEFQIGNGQRVRVNPLDMTVLNGFGAAFRDVRLVDALGDKQRAAIG